jgi:azurin
MTTNRKILSVSLLGLSLFSTYMFFATSEAVAANTCGLTVESTDAMTFNTKNIEVAKTCKDFTITLKHTGKSDKKIMGHNLVITKESDQQAVLDFGSKAGALSNYVKAKDERVIAFTNIIGGGETATTKFAVSKLNSKDSYVFFCSFPSHVFMMKGTVKLI